MGGARLVPYILEQEELRGKGLWEEATPIILLFKLHSAADVWGKEAEGTCAFCCCCCCKALKRLSAWTFLYFWRIQENMSNQDGAFLPRYRCGYPILFLLQEDGGRGPWPVWCCWYESGPHLHTLLRTKEALPGLLMDKV